MILDASAVVDWLLASPGRGAQVAAEVAAAPFLATCDLCDLEVASALRRKVQLGEMSAPRAKGALEDLSQIPVTRYPTAALISRVWELRDNLTAYDAAYVALAEALDAPLLTSDARLAASPGHRAAIRVTNG